MAGARILIAEDEIIIARELEARLLSLGYEVEGIASSGREAIAIAEQVQPQLVLMDIVLKGDMDGIEAAAEIRRRWSLPIVFLTAHADPATLQRARVVEPYGFIVKPFSERELHANLEIALYKHQVETKLRMMEKWFGASMQRIADGVIATTNEGTITYINRVAEIITGWPSSKAIGRESRDVFRLVAHGRPADPEDLVSRTLREGIVTETAGDVFLLNAQNEKIPIDYTGACLRNADGDAIGVVLVFRDLSEHARTEALLRTSEAQLFQAQKLEAIGQLAGGVAHDFNNLLTVINGYSQMVLDELPPESPLHELVGEIGQAGTRAASLTRQLLSFSRKELIEPKVLDLNAVVTAAETMLRRLIGEDVTLTATTAVGLGRVKADAGQMDQVIMNLAVNARDAMPQGGKLTIETSNVDLDDAQTQTQEGVKPGRYVLLAVSDTGCGMTPEVMAHIFEPFFTTKEPGRGTGLGLPTVYGIVKQNGGHLDVHSEPGRGTTFKVYLPITEDRQSPDKSPSELPLMPKGSETILLVEDDAAVRALSRRALHQCGYTLLEARHGGEALRLCREHPGPIHLVVTDVVMPELGGRVLAERLGALKPGIKILYVSGYTDDAVIRHGVLKDDVAFLQKPFTPRSLTQKVREVLEHPGEAHPSNGSS